MESLFEYSMEKNSMFFHGKSWKVCSNTPWKKIPCFSMETCHGVPWKLSMNYHGFPWKHFPWISMENHGIFSMKKLGSFNSLKNPITKIKKKCVHETQTVLAAGLKQEVVAFDCLNWLSI